jgi:hypothetical protein
MAIAPVRYTSIGDFADARLEEEIKEWEEFDHEFFPEVADRTDYRALQAPTPVVGFGWSIVVPRGMYLFRIISAMKRVFNVSNSMSDLDFVLSDDRPRGMWNGYAIFTPEHREADESIQGWSAKELSRQGIRTTTLIEQLRLDFFHWWRTGEHLSFFCSTLCADSMFKGHALTVGWSLREQKLLLDSVRLYDNGKYLCPRRVIIPDAWNSFYSDRLS